jgi:hypothetical protein
MPHFEKILKDTPKMADALALFVSPGTRLEALQLLHQAGEHGLPIARDAVNRIQGPTVWHCSRLGTELSSHFGTGPEDTCLWIGTIRKDEAGEFWVMRPEVKGAIESANLG